MGYASKNAQKHNDRISDQEKVYHCAYCKARYEVARSVAVTMELSEDIKEELFGVRGGKGEILRNGAFPEELVQKALYEASVRNT